MKQASCKATHFFALAAMTMLLFGANARAADKLVDEVVGFTGEVLLLQTRVPALVIGVVRDGKTTVLGFGETSDGSGKPPDGQTMLRVGSLTKAFTGQVLASLVADGTVKFTDRLQDRIGWDVTVPTRDGHEIRLIDLVTHSSGLPRELERQPGPADDPFATLTPEAYRKGLASDPLVFAPGTGALYSNFGFDVLSAALSHAAAKPYDALLKERILDPVGLKDTVLSLRPGDEARLLQGHNFDGKPMPKCPDAADRRGGERHLLDSGRHPALAVLASRPLRVEGCGDPPARPCRLSSARRPQSGRGTGRIRSYGCHQPGLDRHGAAR